MKHTSSGSLSSISKHADTVFLLRPPIPPSAAGETATSLLESIHCMADWKQITARIRRARTSKDPAGQLTNLFSKTRDAMVAFELARYFETSGNPADAGRWYLTAAERFRRADWKTKAQESATRLGATEPAEIPEPVRSARSEEPALAEKTEEAAAPESEVAEPSQASTQAERPSAPAAEPNRHRRGRRGGRDSRPSRREREPQQRATARDVAPPLASSRRSMSAEPAPEAPETTSIEAVSEAPASVPSLRGKYGDPGLASRLTQLEMNFRRLLSSTPASLDAADKAPAGPGVWVLTDSDLTTYYYVEPCQTLRVAIPNLLRGGSTRKGENIRPRLAEHLGIPESRVAKYLGDHCVVRWLQMDEDAAHFAHFLVAVLRPALNE
ncbi:MAG: hypothetical protein WAM58_03575 [Candidatus Acidiferrum sp.]